MSAEEDFSFEHISQIRQKERRKPLSRLPPDFYERFTDKLEKLKGLYQEENTKDPTSLRAMMYADEVRKTKLILDEINRRRLRKILLASLNSSAHDSDPPTELLPQEKQLFDDIVATLRNNKKDLEAMLGMIDEDGEMPETEIKTEDLIVMEPQVETAKEEPAPAEGDGEEEGMALVRVLGDTGSFMSPDQRSYNLRKEDILEIPMSIAKILIDNKKAELYSA